MRNYRNCWLCQFQLPHDNSNFIFTLLKKKSDTLQPNWYFVNPSVGFAYNANSSFILTEEFMHCTLVACGTNI